MTESNGATPATEKQVTWMDTGSLKDSGLSGDEILTVLNPTAAQKQLDSRDQYRLYMVVVIGLLTVAIIAVAATLWLLMSGKSESAALLALATGCIGGVVGLFAKSPTNGASS